MSHPLHFHPTYEGGKRRVVLSIVAAAVVAIFSVFIYLAIACHNGYTPFVKERDLEESLRISGHKEL